MKPVPVRRRAALMLAAAAALLAVGIPLTTMAAGRVAVTTGMTGTTGTLHVTSCVQPHRGGARRYCVGVFTPDDGTRHDDDAVVTAASRPGAVLPVHRTSAGQYLAGAAAAALGWSAAAFLGLSLLALALACLLALPHRTRPHRSVVGLAALFWAAALISGLAAAASSVTGAG